MELSISNIIKNNKSNITCGIASFIRRHLGVEDNELISKAQEMMLILKSLEKIPVRFPEEGSESSLQETDFEKYITSAKMLLEKMRDSHSKRVHEEMQILERFLFGLLYRLEGVNGGLDPESVNERIFADFSALASEWKFNQPIFRHKLLTESDYVILQEACQYSNIIYILMENVDLRSEFFNWTLRDKISVRSFIEFPGMQSKIMDCSLNGRIGRLGGKSLKISYLHSELDNYSEKVLTLPFEGKDLSILDENQAVMFRGNYGLTIGEIFQVFKDKRLHVGNLEFMADGIINWNVHLWGFWDEEIQDYRKIDLNLPEWWNQLPLMEVLTLRQARKKYGAHLDGQYWNVAAVATRASPTLDYQESHAYSSVAIPIGDGNYKIFSFGKFATQFPSTLLHAFANLGKTSEATVAYPDENVFYTHRQRTRYSYALNEEQGLKFMFLIKQDMLSAMTGHLVYQIQSENCAKWTYMMLEKVIGPNRVPNLFQMPFLDSEPEGVMKLVFAFVKSLPVQWQVPFTTFCHLPLGACKGRWIYEHDKLVWKSLTHHEFWLSTVIYHPSMLHKQQEVGFIGFYVPAGITSSILNSGCLDIRKEIVTLWNYQCLILLKVMKYFVMVLQRIPKLVDMKLRLVEKVS